MKRTKSLHSLARLLAVGAIIFLVAGWNGVYNLYKLASQAESIGGYTFAGPHAHRSLTYLTISGVLMVASILISLFQSYRNKRGAGT